MRLKYVWQKSGPVSSEKLDRVSRHDNYFDLGGHSLAAVTVIEQIRRAGLAIEVRALFSAPTLVDLAADLGGELREVEVPRERYSGGLRGDHT